MVRLDTSVKSFRLDADGKKQATAVDLISGATYVKVAAWMPWKSPRSGTAEHHAEAVALHDQGAHNDHSDDEHFRGVWIPEDEAEPGLEPETETASATPAPRGRKPGKR